MGSVRKKSHSSKPSGVVPYAHARQALSIPAPEDGSAGFEWVEQRPSLSNDSHVESAPAPTPTRRPKTADSLGVPPSPGYLPESPIVGHRWSTSQTIPSTRDSYFSSTTVPSDSWSSPKQRLRPLSEVSTDNSLRDASLDGLAFESFTYGVTARVGTPLSSMARAGTPSSVARERLV